MTVGLLGLMDIVLGKNSVTPAYRTALMTWQDRALRAVRKNVGVVPGMAVHYWHGKRDDRGYSRRWKILAEFDPTRDIARDAAGVWQLVDDGSERMRRMRDDLRAYFRSRNEDSIDL